MKKKNPKSTAFLLLLAGLLLFSLTVSRLDQSRHREGLLQLEQVLRRTAIACYAAEGFYPPDVAYMQDHYGLRYNENEFLIHYEVFASNLMPDITVLER